MKINENYLNLANSYLFSSIAKKVREFKQNNPDKKVISLGIGDVTRPLVPSVTNAMQRAVTQMGNKETFHGYGEEQGYLFLRQAIATHYGKKNVMLSTDEIFVSDGAKSDLGNILDIFSTQNTVLIPDPVYPVYRDSNIMAGRKIVYMDANAQNGFLPMPNDNITADIIYLCSPNNPTGAVYSKQQLAQWVDFARKTNAVILFDSAYECFIKNDQLPTSIYQIDGAKECAIEFCSLSKTAGFTGTRCGYTVVPKALKCGAVELNQLWLRRQTTKFNGVPYVVQRGAEAIFTHEGQLQISADIDYYLTNAQMIAECMRKLKIDFVGGENSPYIWFKIPCKMTSWEFFELLLNKTAVVGTPGMGFGECGEGYMRFSAFGTFEDTSEAMERIKSLDFGK